MSWELFIQFWVHVAPFWPLLPLGLYLVLRWRHDLPRRSSLPKLFAASIGGTALVQLMIHSNIDNTMIVLPFVSWLAYVLVYALIDFCFSVFGSNQRGGR